MNNAYLLTRMGTGGKVFFECLSSTEMGKEGGWREWRRMSVSVSGSHPMNDMVDEGHETDTLP